MVLERQVHFTATLHQQIIVSFTSNLPVDDVVSRMTISHGISVACEIYKLESAAIRIVIVLKETTSHLHHELKVHLRVFVNVDAKDQLAPAYEFETRCSFVESGHLHHISKLVSVQTCN